jgi:6-phosphogluconolactonase
MSSANAPKTGAGGRAWLWVSLVAALIVGGLGVGIAAAAPGSGHSRVADAPAAGAVFILSNAAHGNRVLAYDRSAAGTLTRVGSFPTFGLGSGAPLKDAGALALSADHHWLLAVNAGSNTVSVLRVNPLGTTPFLSFTSEVASHGLAPVSVAIHGNLVYVVNAGNATVPGSVSGYRLDPSGELVSIPNAERLLPGANPMPAQIGFTPSGGVLVVTEKATNRIVTYVLGTTGAPREPKSYRSIGATPFGFAFTPTGVLLVSEAKNSQLASFAVSATGIVSPITRPLANGEMSACWVAVPTTGGFAFTSDTGSNVLSSYAVHTGGKLSLLRSIAARTMAAPEDSAFSAANGFLYVHDAAAGSIQGFVFHSDGAISPVTSTSGLPAAAEGLAAF